MSTARKTPAPDDPQFNLFSGLADAVDEPKLKASATTGAAS